MLRSLPIAAILCIDPAADGQTRVRLTHAGFGDGGDWDGVHAYFDRAWTNVLAALQKHVSKPADSASPPSE